MQVVAVGKPFDGADALALGLHGEHQAGSDRLVVENHGACAADAVLAADMRAGEPALVADDIDQRLSRLDPSRVIVTVDIELDVDLLGCHCHFAVAARQLLE